LKPAEGIKVAKERVKTDYAFREHITPKAKEYLENMQPAEIKEELEEVTV
jgi:hypothetical protein